MLLFACSDEEPPEPADASAEASCSDVFGDTPVYMPCGEDEISCSFYTRGAIRTCADVCEEFAGKCVESYEAESNCALASPDLGCMVPNTAHVCVCLRP